MSITGIRSCATFASQLNHGHPFALSMDYSVTNYTTEKDHIRLEEDMRKHQLTVYDGDREGRTTCYQAAECDNVPLLHHLFKTYGLGLFTYGSSYGLIPLHAAVANWKLGAAWIIIGYGSPMNILTETTLYDRGGDYPSVPEGATPLDIAIKMHSTALVILLKLNGGLRALPEQLNEGDQSVLDEADNVIAAKKKEAEEMIPYVDSAVSVLPTPVIGIITQYAVRYPEYFFD
jgi:hypothetical protein